MRKGVHRSDSWQAKLISMKPEKTYVVRWCVVHALSGYNARNNRGSDTFATEEEANDWIKGVHENNTPEIIARFFPHGLVAKQWKCYPIHYDPKGPLVDEGTPIVVWEETIEIGRSKENVWIWGFFLPPNELVQMGMFVSREDAEEYAKGLFPDAKFIYRKP